MRRLYPVIVAVLSISAACHNMSNYSAAGELAAVVVFDNESIDQAAVYAVTPGSDPYRIGTVMAGRTDTLTIPPAIASAGRSVNIIARPLAGSRAPQTGPVSISPGEWIQVRMGSDQRSLVVLPAR